MLAGSSRPRGEQSEAQRIQKRRMTNRRSQQRARDNKEALIRTLQKEVERLKRQPVSVKSVERYVGGMFKMVKAKKPFL